MNRDAFVKLINEIVDSRLEKLGLNVAEWNYGTVATVNADRTLGVRINGSTYITPSVKANPSVTFAVGDKVWVQFVNRNPNNLYVTNKR